MNCSDLVHFPPTVPPGGADCDDWGDLSAHQFCFLQPLVLHRPGNLRDAYPPLSLPTSPETLQGGCSGTCAELYGHSGHFADLLPVLPQVPLAIAITFTVVCFFIVVLSLYSDPWNTGVSCALTLTGVPVYYLTVHSYRLPRSWKRAYSE